MGKMFILPVTLTLLYAGAAPAYAAGDAQSACMDDALKLCGDEIPFISEIEDCLEANMPQLSVRCRKEFSGPESRSLLREEDFQ
mgnify:FL=1|jgi:hypothetical protein